MTVVFETNKDYSIKYILALLNSRLLNYRYKSIGKQTGGGSFEYFPNGIGKLPIPKISLELQQPFIALADSMISLKAQLLEKRNRFSRRLRENLEVSKITDSLQSFDKLSFEDITLELKKQKIRLTLTQQDEWESYFNERKLECQELTVKIAATDKEIDRRVYDLYGLTPKERQIVLEG